MPIWARFKPMKGGVAMNVEVRGETVVITGYVNAVERYSKPIRGDLRDTVQTFIERIKAGVFKTALKRNDDVKVLLNHNVNRELATTKDGSAKLEEDNIGLRAEVIITDKEVVQKARENKLVGWSFGFYPNAEEIGTEGEYPTRTLTDLDLVEVSILDDTKSPAYYGTSIETRSEGGKKMEIRGNEIPESEQMPEEKPTPEVRESGFNVDELAEILAVKVIEKLKAETRGEENENEPEAEEEPEEKEEIEPRAIDYSSFENRLAQL